MEADLDRDGKISFEEFTKMVENTDVSMSMTLGMSPALEPTQARALQAHCRDPGDSSWPGWSFV